MSRWPMARPTNWQIAYGLEMLRRHMERPTNWQFSYGWDALEMTVTREVIDSWR